MSLPSYTTKSSCYKKQGGVERLTIQHFTKDTLLHRSTYTFIVIAKSLKDTPLLCRRAE